MLVEAVRDAAEQLAEADPGAIPRIVQALEQRNYPVFERIALHLLRVRADSPLDLVRDRLIRKDLFDSSAHRHEYTLLLRQRFGRLAPADREHILGWIEAGPDLQALRCQPRIVGRTPAFRRGNRGFRRSLPP